jgi:hypothetical protein
VRACQHATIEILPRHFARPRSAWLLLRAAAAMAAVAEGAALVGSPLRKRFGARTHAGTVQTYDAAEKYYLVQYDDGDTEELELYELQPLLVSPSGGAKSGGAKAWRSSAAAPGAASPASPRGASPAGRRTAAGGAIRAGAAAAAVAEAAATPERRGAALASGKPGGAARALSPAGRAAAARRAPPQAGRLAWLWRLLLVAALACAILFIALR